MVYLGRPITHVEQGVSDAAQPTPEALARELSAVREELQALRLRIDGSLPATTPVIDQTLSPAAFGEPEAEVATVTTERRSTSSFKPLGETDSTLPGQANPVDPTHAQKLAKAEELLSRGDIAGARLILEHLLRAGSAAAAFKLAETYDPGRLSAWRVYGVRGDPQKARELYEMAFAGGHRPRPSALPTDGADSPIASRTHRSGDPGTRSVLVQEPDPLATRRVQRPRQRTAPSPAR
jgi:hypothetical protein